MDAEKIKSALADVTAEQDTTIKSLKMASLCSALWAEHGVELVVVGGSAIEILTEGAYASGDLDMCVESSAGSHSSRIRSVGSSATRVRNGARFNQASGTPPWTDFTSWTQGDCPGLAGGTASACSSMPVSRPNRMTISRGTTASSGCALKSAAGDLR